MELQSSGVRTHLRIGQSEINPCQRVTQIFLFKNSSDAGITVKCVMFND